jgi:ribosomal protein S27AE
MKRGICPKCESREVFYQPGHPLQSEKVTLKSGVVSRGTAPDRYVCGSCGLVEYYLSGAEDLEVVRETWEPVRPE